MLFYCLLERAKAVQPIEALDKNEAAEEMLLRYNTRGAILNEEEFKSNLELQEWKQIQKIG